MQKRSLISLCEFAMTMTRMPATEQRLLQQTPFRSGPLVCVTNCQPTLTAFFEERLNAESLQPQAHRLENPAVKQYALKYRRAVPMIPDVFLVEGAWSFWEHLEQKNRGPVSVLLGCQTRVIRGWRVKDG